MKLYLSSYRVGDNTEELKKWLESHDKKKLVIPNALDVFPDGERKTNGILEKNNDLVALGFEPEILDLRDYFNKPDVLKEKLRSYRAFYV